MAALERQGDEDAVIDRRTRPASWLQVLIVLKTSKQTKLCRSVVSVAHQQLRSSKGGLKLHRTRRGV